MRRLTIFLVLILLTGVLGGQAQEDLIIHTVAEGLYFPAGMALLPDGGLLIAEAGGHGERSAGISLLTPAGDLGRLISGLPNSYSRDNLISAPVVALTPDGATILVGLAGSQLYSLPSAAARALPDEPFGPLDLQPRQTGGGNVFLLHPFDIAFDPSGAPLVTDSAGNGLVSENPDGSLRYWQRFAALDNPQHGGGRLEALPTGLARHNDAFYVTLFGGCPHVPNSGELVALDDDGRQRTIVDGLNMPVDVALDAAGALWLLEFASDAPTDHCFAGLQRQEASGRLSRISPQGAQETVLEGLRFPTAVLPRPDGGLYITEAYSGRLLHIEFDAEPGPPRRYPPGPKTPRSEAELLDLDRALRAVIAEHELSPYPGQDIKEPESELTRLGRDLFFDPILSGDQNISCGTCHHPEFAMTDGRVLPIGAGGHGLGESRVFRKLIHLPEGASASEGMTVVNPFVDTFIPRNSPTVINSALLRGQFWDGRVEMAAADETVSTLEDAVNDLDLTDPLTAQVLFPITSQHEMAGVTLGEFSPTVIRLLLLERLRGVDAYVERFAAAFDNPTITLRRLAEAVAAFERQLIFTESPWDDYVAGDADALSDGQKRGALLFFGALNLGVNCAACHSGDLFTDQRFHNLLAPQLGPGKDNGIDGRDDFGRANVSFDHRDQYRFRTPSLRNVELTPPYFHSGAYDELEAVVWHHADPWRANILYEPTEHLPRAFQSQVLAYNFERQAHSASRRIGAGMPVSEGDVADLVAFLRSLTDPAARDLSHITPTAVPSGLPLDPLPR